MKANNSLLLHFRDIPKKDGLCEKCGQKFKKLTKDHIIPKSKGGINYAMNCDFLCQQCNSSKNDSIPPLSDIKRVYNLTTIALKEMETTITQEYETGSHNLIYNSACLNLDHFFIALNNLKKSMAHKYHYRLQQIIDFRDVLEKLQKEAAKTI